MAFIDERTQNFTDPQFGDSIIGSNTQAAPGSQLGNEPAPTPTSSGSSMPTGIDPRLAAVYQKAGMTPGGQGSGFADWQYWQDKMNTGGDPDYFINRLTSDLAGTGTDQPTGTPGQGVWSNSGAADRAGGSSGYSSSSSSNGPAMNFMGKATEPYQQTPQDSALYNMLMSRATQGLNVSPDDPIIKAQTDAFRAEQGRGVKNYLSGAAERGGQYANLDAAERSGNEKAAQNTAGFQASLMNNELTARRAEIAQALQEQGSLLSVQDQLGLQRELGLIDSTLRGRQIGNQNEQYYAGLGLGYNQLGSQNDQFAANYNLNATDKANYWDSLRRGLISG